MTLSSIQTNVDGCCFDHGSFKFIYILCCSRCSGEIQLGLVSSIHSQSLLVWYNFCYQLFKTTLCLFSSFF